MKITVTSRLRMDAVYFQMALGLVRRVEVYERRFASAYASLRESQRAESTRGRVFGDTGDAPSVADDVSDLVTDHERKDVGTRLHRLMVPLVSCCATVHVVCAASLEAHANLVAAEQLAGAELGSFDRLQTRGKWALLPRLLGKPGFDAGSQPFQSLQRLLSRRNRLIHHKPLHKVLSGDSIPSSVPELGLTAKDCEESIQCVRDMVVELSGMLGETAPRWLRIGPGRAFDIQFRFDEEAG
ncbi:MAG: hypothetical protein ACYTDX_01300 [Planctomycetota bacterium]|jgi:hypothetical protein